MPTTPQPPRAPRPTRTSTLLPAGWLLAATLVACKGAPDGRRDDTTAAAPRTLASMPSPAADVAAAAPTDPGRLRAAVDPTRKIIRTGQLTIQVEDYDAAAARIEALLAEAGGYLDRTDVVRRAGAVSDATLVLRVPADRFGALVRALGGLGELQAEHTDAADVTAHFVDTTARRDAARALEARLLQLVADRTGSVADVLEVERELARVRAEIEQHEGQLRLWQHQADLATLTVALTTRAPELAAPTAEHPGFGARSSSTFHRSVAAAVALVSALGLALVALVPWLPLVLPLAIALWRLGRRAVRWAQVPRAHVIVGPAPAMPAAPAPMPAAPPSS